MLHQSLTAVHRGKWWGVEELQIWFEQFEQPAWRTGSACRVLNKTSTCCHIFARPSWELSCSLQSRLHWHCTVHTAHCTPLPHTAVHTNIAYKTLAVAGWAAAARGCGMCWARAARCSHAVRAAVRGRGARCGGNTISWEAKHKPAVREHIHQLTPKHHHCSPVRPTNFFFPSSCCGDYIGYNFVDRQKTLPPRPLPCTFFNVKKS